MLGGGVALWLIRSGIPDRKRFAGLVIGFAGVIALLGIDVRGDAPDLLGAGAVLLSALGYAAAALLYRRWLDDVPALAVTALMTAMSRAAAPKREQTRSHWQLEALEAGSGV